MRISSFEILKKAIAFAQRPGTAQGLIVQGSYGDPIEISYYNLFNNEAGFIVPRVHELKDVYRALGFLRNRISILTVCLQIRIRINRLRLCIRR